MYDGRFAKPRQCAQRGSLDLGQQRQPDGLLQHRRLRPARRVDQGHFAGVSRARRRPPPVRGTDLRRPSRRPYRKPPYARGSCVTRSSYSARIRGKTPSILIMQS